MDSLCPSPRAWLRWRWYAFWEKHGPRVRGSFVVRLGHHLMELPRVKSGERWNYIRGKSRMALSRLHASSPANDSTTDGATFAPATTPEQGVPNYQKILVRYRPKSYGGKVDLIVSDGMDFKGLILDWARHAQGGHEVHRVPGDHMTYIREHVQNAAAKLRLCLDGAHSDAKR